MPVWAIRIQGLLLPIGRYWYLSITGPHRNFTDQGRVPSVSNIARSFAANPSAARYVTNVTVMNPHGIPCAT